MTISKEPLLHLFQSKMESLFDGIIDSELFLKEMLQYLEKYIRINQIKCNID